MPHRRFLIPLLFVLGGVVSVPESTPARTKKKQQADRTMAVDARVVISACVISGKVTVRGWDRNEVHVRSDNTVIQLTRLDRSKSGSAAEVKLTASGDRSMSNSCLHGDLDLEVPRGATLRLRITSGDLLVTDVLRVSVQSQSGSLTATKLRNGMDATTIGGDISVRDSSGSFSLHSVGGTVVAENVGPSAAGNFLEIGTIGGDVNLTNVAHPRLSLNTVSGDVTYSGGLARSGRYYFQTISGTLILSLPADSSFRVAGMVGHGGKVNGDFNLKYANNEGAGHPSSIRAVAGSGDASITISSFAGSITIRKK